MCVCVCARARVTCVATLRSGCQLQTSLFRFALPLLGELRIAAAPTGERLTEYRDGPTDGRTDASRDAYTERYRMERRLDAAAHRLRVEKKIPRGLPSCSAHALRFGIRRSVRCRTGRPASITGSARARTRRRAVDASGRARSKRRTSHVARIYRPTCRLFYSTAPVRRTACVAESPGSRVRSVDIRRFNKRNASADVVHAAAATTTTRGRRA